MGKINASLLKQWFDLYNRKQSLESGEMFMFSKNWTKEDNERKIKEIEEKMAEIDKEMHNGN